MIKIKTLPNNLRLVFEYIPYVKSVSAGVWIGSGSRFESDKNWGISHFIEHMLFKGTAGRTAKEIAEETDSIGGQLNAFTARDCTCFYTKTLSGHLDISLSLLSDMLINSKFDKNDIYTESFIVKEEIDMYEDTPEELVHDILADVCYNKHPLGKNILGCAKTIESFNYDKIKSYMDMRYCTDNIVISVAGNFEENALVQMVEEYFGNVSNRQSVNEITKPPVFVSGKEIRYKQVEQAHIAIAFPGVSYRDDDMYALMLVSNVLGGGMSSRLFQNIREKKGLAYSIYSYPNIFDDTGYTTVYAACAKEKYSEVVSLIYDEISQLREKGISEEEFLRAKEQMKGNYILSAEGTTSRMSSAGKQLLLHDIIKTDDDILKKTDEISSESVNSVLKLFDDKIAAISIVMPK